MAKHKKVFLLYELVGVVRVGAADFPAVIFVTLIFVMKLTK